MLVWRKGGVMMKMVEILVSLVILLNVAWYFAEKWRRNNGI